ncbi:hypothetical protein V2J09_017754 [Rumex salicifolius]
MVCSDAEVSHPSVTRTRIDVTRRKQNATQKFLKQDIAELLADGLESNAFGRVEGLIAEMIHSSCYEFVDHVCEIILKHLSTIQKHGECPDEGREAVASLMFAAARFSDSPELRELRNIFQERYGNTLEYYLVEHINPEPPDMEKKLKLLQNIASEFSVNWDSFAFEDRIIINAATIEEKPATCAFIQAARYSVAKEEIVHKVDDAAPVDTKTFEASHQMKGREVVKKEHFAQGAARRQNTGKSPFQEQEQLDHNKHRPPIGLCKTEEESVMARRREFMIIAKKNPLSRENASSTSEAETAEPVVHSQHKNSFSHKTASPGKVETLPDQKLQVVETDKFKCNSRSDMYVKPYKSRLKPRHPESRGNGHHNDTLTFFNPGAENLEPVAADIPHYTAVYYKDDTDSTPRRRSRRRRHKSSSIPCDGEKVYTSRSRNESVKGRKVPTEDTEERMMDRLLLHYSKKPMGVGVPSEKKAKEKAKNRGERSDDVARPPPSRSMSLPLEQSSSEFNKVVFTRAVSFDQEASAPAKHVHPKLPDYDDLAARFAALRRNHV